MVPFRNVTLSAAVIVVLATTARAQFFEPFDLGFPEFPVEGQVVDSEADRKIKQADDEYHKGNHDAVIRVTDEMLLTSPSNVAALHLRAAARIEKGRRIGVTQLVRTGIEDSRKALSLEGRTKPWLYIPYLFGMTTLAELEKKPAHAQVARDAVRPVLARTDLKDDERSQLYFQLGLANIAMGKPGDAVGDLQQTLKINPRHPSAHLKLAQALTATGKVKEALASLNLAVEMLPNSPLVMNERGMVRRMAGDLEGAIEDFTAAVKFDPKAAVCLVNRGVTLLDLNQAAAAEADFTEAMKLQPADTMIRQLRGTARVVQGNFEAGIKDYTVVIEKFDVAPIALQDRAFARFYRGDFAGAADDFADALEEGPKLVYLVPWQALATIRSGQADEGKKLLEEFVKRPATEIGWVGMIANCLLGKLDDQALLKATMDAKGNPQANMQTEAWYFLGQKKLLAGDSAGAQELFQKASALNQHGMAACRAARFDLERK